MFQNTLFLSKISPLWKKESFIIIFVHKRLAATVNTIVITVPKATTPITIAKVVNDDSNNTTLFNENILVGRNNENLSPNKLKLLSLLLALFTKVYHLHHHSRRINTIVII